MKESVLDQVVAAYAAPGASNECPIKERAPEGKTTLDVPGFLRGVIWVWTDLQDAARMNTECSDRVQYLASESVVAVRRLIDDALCVHHQKEGAMFDLWSDWTCSIREIT